MFSSVRRLLGTVAGVLALLGPLSGISHAQFLPINPSMNFPGAVMQTQAALHNPFAAGFGVLGNPTFGFGLGFGPNALGYASLLNSGGFGLRGGFGLYGGLTSGFGFYGGYGSLAALSGYGAAGSYFQPQWMMNPYQGYLQGAADITRANAKYFSTIQEAKLQRQEAIRSSLQTRRAFLEEAEYERSRMPDPLKLRELATARELDRARVSPPLNDIWSARSLNSLLDHLVARQAEGAKGQRVPLSVDILSHVNLTSGDTRGNAGLLRDNGRLKWPLVLQKDYFKEPREKIDRLMRRAYQAVQIDHKPDDAILHDLRASYRQMQDALAANVDNLTTDEYMQARRYLGQIHNAITVLKDRNVVNHFNGNWAPHVKSVGELVQFMRDKGLVFAPATQSDEAAYLSLYNALAEFDAGMPRVAQNRSSGGSDKK